jgi:hypothetical protein
MKSILLEIYYRSAYIIVTICLIECFSYLMQGPQLEYFSGLFTFNYQAIDFNFIEDTMIRQHIYSNQPLPITRGIGLNPLGPFILEPSSQMQICDSFTLYPFRTNENGALFSEGFWQTDLLTHISWLSNIGDTCVSVALSLCPLLECYATEGGSQQLLLDKWVNTGSLNSVVGCQLQEKEIEVPTLLLNKSKAKEITDQAYECIDFFFSYNYNLNNQESDIMEKDLSILQPKNFPYLSSNEAKAWFHLFIGYLSYFYCLKLNKTVLYYLLEYTKQLYIAFFIIIQVYAVLIPGILKLWISKLACIITLTLFLSILSKDIILMLIITLEELQLEQLDSELI